MQVVRYNNPGEIIDTLHLDFGVKYPMLWEVFGSTSPNCLEYFNPVEEKSFSSVLESWSQALLITCFFLQLMGLIDVMRENGWEMTVCHIKKKEEVAAKYLELRSRHSTLGPALPLAAR